jgi:fatty acid desaturase
MTTDPFDRAVEKERSERRQRRRRAARAGFRVHLAVFAAVQALIFVTWLVTSGGDFPWFVFPLLGWGIGLAAHAAAVYGGGIRRGPAAPQAAAHDPA